MTSTIISRQQSPEHLVHEENSLLDCLTPPREWIEATAKMVRNFLGSEDTFDSTWFKHCFNHHILNAKNTKWAKKVTEEDVKAVLKDDVLIRNIHKLAQDCFRIVYGSAGAEVEDFVPNLGPSIVVR